MMYRKNTKTMATHINTIPQQLGGTQELAGRRCNK
jgi:hypothetical protein